MKTFLLALALTLLPTLSPTVSVAHADETQPTADCMGRVQLYNPEQFNVLPKSWVLGGEGNSIGKIFQDLPVAFAPSGDQCLGPIPVYRVSLHADPARDTHAMARRLAPEMQSYSRLTGEEACARMCRLPDGQIVAQLVTLHAHVVCLALENTCPEGSTPTAETTHSHPPHSAFIANPVDALGWEEPEINGKLTLTGYPDSLSPNDRRQAPVWLVGTRGQLVWLDKPDGQEVERP